jgi:low affinity Fe/Cu permease
MNKWFTRFATKVSDMSGSRWAFLGAMLVVIVWAVSGPIFNFSDSWQLVINTITNLATFLMVFVIQNSQSRDTKALHVKLDEIIHVIGPAHNELLDVENLTDTELKRILKAYNKVGRRAHTERDVEEAISQTLGPAAGS